MYSYWIPTDSITKQRVPCMKRYEVFQTASLGVEARRNGGAMAHYFVTDGPVWCEQANALSLSHRHSRPERPLGLALAERQLIRAHKIQHVV